MPEGTDSPETGDVVECPHSFECPYTERYPIGNGFRQDLLMRLFEEENARHARALEKCRNMVIL